MTRSFPEKTFEHWCSMHLSYRYRAKMLMWWPTSGADIEIVNSPQTWGKRFWLELKTTEWKAGVSQQRHELSIDLDQLNQYGQQAIPDYYVFPIPPWTGVLGPSSASKWLGGLAPERLAYQSWSGDKWFSQWTWVVPGWALRKALSTEIAALPTTAKKKTPHLIAKVRHGNLTWQSTALESMPMRRWRDFWVSMEQCGDRDWPAQFLLPPNFGLTLKMQRSDLVSKLQQLAENDNIFGGEAVLYDRVEGDDYAAQTDGQAPFPEFNWDEGSRAIIALNEHALTAGLALV